MFLRDELWHIADYFTDSLFPIFYLFMVDMLEMIEEYLFDLLMLLYFYPFLILDERYIIMHPSLHRGSVEEFGVALPLLQPSDP